MFLQLHIARGCFFFFFLIFCHSVGLNSDDREHRACKTQIFTIWLFLEKEFGRLWPPGQDGKKLEELMRASWRASL